MGQDVLSQWQFISIRRQLEKGRYYHEYNQHGDSAEVFDASSAERAKDNPKVSNSNFKVEKVIGYWSPKGIG